MLQEDAAKFLPREGVRGGQGHALYGHLPALHMLPLASPGLEHTCGQISKKTPQTSLDSRQPYTQLLKFGSSIAVDEGENGDGGTAGWINPIIHLMPHF